MSKFTAREKADCAERELKMRLRVYPIRVADGRMTQALATRQTSLMEEIFQEYAAAAEVEEAQGKLL